VVGDARWGCNQAVPESVVDPMKYYRNNLVGTINLIDCMDAHNCKTLGVYV
jgi:UDP-glucose 4-epimerase